MKKRASFEKRATRFLIGMGAVAVLLGATLIPKVNREQREYEQLQLAVATTETSPHTTAYTEAKTESKYPLTDMDIDLIALCAIAEAEGECEKGQRLVIDVILNRRDSEHFPNSIGDVILQPNQFTSMWNGRAERCVITPEMRKLVKEELLHRTNTDVIFFRTGRYSDYGVPLFKVDHHYFSSYE